jgi:hypothetical protein
MRSIIAGAITGAVAVVALSGAWIVILSNIGG